MSSRGVSRRGLLLAGLAGSAGLLTVAATPVAAGAAPRPGDGPGPVLAQEYGWKWCSACQQLFHPGTDQDRCPYQGRHDRRDRSVYRLWYNPTREVARGMQENWRWCRWCSALWYPVAWAPGVCLGRPGGHSVEQSLNYVMLVGPEREPDWRWCHRCGCLFYHGLPNNACAAGGQHDGTRSYDYSLTYVP